MCCVPQHFLVGGGILRASRGFWEGGILVHGNQGTYSTGLQSGVRPGASSPDGSGRPGKR